MEGHFINILTNLGQPQLNSVMILALIGLAFYSTQTRAKQREDKLRSEKNDIEMQATHLKDVEVLRAQMQTQKHALLEKISDNGTLFEERLKEQNMHLNLVLARAYQAVAFSEPVDTTKEEVEKA